MDFVHLVLFEENAIFWGDICISVLTWTGGEEINEWGELSEATEQLPTTPSSPSSHTSFSSLHIFFSALI